MVTDNTASLHLESGRFITSFVDGSKIVYPSRLLLPDWYQAKEGVLFRFQWN